MPKMNRQLVCSCVLPVPWPLQCSLVSHFSYFLCCMRQKGFPFLPSACNRGNSRPDISMQAWSMSLTRTVGHKTLSLMLIDGLTVQLTSLVPMLWNLGPFCASRQTWNCLWNVESKNCMVTILFLKKFIHTAW